MIDFILEGKNRGRYTTVWINFKSRILPIGKTHTSCAVSRASLSGTACCC